MKSILSILVITLFSTTMISQGLQELGTVDWLRSYDDALEQSKQEDKPVLILFQEVPGCATCRNYGDDVLSNPLLVDIIEHYFVPLAIFNNKGGEDRKILSKYNEPTWNNPVVRIVDERGENLIDRINGNYSSAGLLSGIVQSFAERGKRIPQDIQLLQDILNTQPTALATYSMYCFWSGEKAFGKLNGVYSTTAGWQDGREVVQVVYDDRLISEKQLTKKGEASQCADDILEGDKGFRKDKDPKYYLKHSVYKQLPMHPLQATRINSLLGEGIRDVSDWLFPSQRKWMETNGNSSMVLYDEDFDEAWETMKDNL